MNVVAIKGARPAPRAVRSSMETMLLTVETVTEQFVVPRGPGKPQRDLKVTDKVRACAEELKRNGGFISGVLTLGRIDGDKATYVVDGQHRLEAFKISGLKECIADVRILSFKTMAELAEEFVLAQKSLVRMGPDDILRGMEAYTEVLQQIRKACPFVAYGNIRRGDPKSPVLSLSAVLRCWYGSRNETPTCNTSGKSVEDLAQELADDDAKTLIVFLLAARSAWGSDPEYYRMWGNLNVAMCMWLYRQIVLNKERGVKRAVVLTPEQFRKCLMSLSADGGYLDWLPGRQMTERDRSPCYARVRNIFVTRIKQDMPGDKGMMPSPPWYVTRRSDPRLK